MISKLKDIKIRNMVAVLLLDLIIVIFILGPYKLSTNILVPSTLKLNNMAGAFGKILPSEESQIILSFNNIISPEKLIFDINNNEKDCYGRVYYDVDNITGDKYIDFLLVKGKNTIVFNENARANIIRIDFPENVEKYGVTLLHIENNNVVRRQFFALIIIIITCELFVLFCGRKILNIICNKYICYIISITILLYLSLYGKYIWQHVIYGFTDVGSDTFYGYLPQYLTMLEKLRNVDFSLFNLYDGIGNSIMAGANIHMELPFLFILLLFDVENIYLGLFFCTFLKVLFLEICAFLFYRQLALSAKISVICSILWGFSGYVLLWGQHSYFLTAMCFFSLLMLIIEKIINTRNKQYWLFFSLLVGLYSICNIYFLYSCLATGGVYFFFRQIYIKRNIRDIVGQSVKYIAFAFLGIGMFLFVSMEWIICVIESARKIGTEKFSLIEFSLDNCVRILARVVSTEAFGVSNYTGSNNLYEDPIIATSILTIFGIYWLCKKNKKNLGIIILIFLSFFMPVISRLFILLNSNRWFYFYSFISVIAIGIMLNDLYERKKVWSLIDNIFVISISVCIIALLVYGGKKLQIDYQEEAFFFKFICLVIFLLIFNMNVKHTFGLLLILCFVEVVGGNYNLINDRTNLTKENYLKIAKGDAQELIDKIKLEDSNQLFRIRVYDFRDYLSHGGVGLYLGTNSYSSLNKKYNIEFISNLHEADSAYAISNDPNHFDISCENYAIQTLLGVRYVITSANAPINYEKYAEIGEMTAYYNTCAIPFGILYDEKMPKEDYLYMSPLQKNLSLFDAYYLTDYDSNGDKDKFLNGDYTLKNLDGFKFEDNIITGICTDENESIEIERDNKGAEVEMIIEMEAPATGLYLKVYYAGEGEMFSEDKVVYRYLINGKREYSLYFPTKSISKFKIIPIIAEGDNQYEFEIYDISFVDWEENYDIMYLQKAKEIQENRSVYNVSFINDEYHAYCISQKNNTMLLIPLSYSINWSASVNGEKIEVVRVDDAFCGIYLPEGECMIEMVYETKGKELWCIISALSCLVWTFFMINCGCKNINTKITSRHLK